MCGFLLLFILFSQHPYEDGIHVAELAGEVEGFFELFSGEQSGDG